MVAEMLIELGGQRSSDFGHFGHDRQISTFPSLLLASERPPDGVDFS
jgi:hypothetical protein